MDQLQNDLNENFPSSKISILAVNEEGQESQNDLAAEGRNLPLLQDVDANNNNESDVWASWGVTWRDVWVLDKNNEVQDIRNLTVNDLAQQANYDDLRQTIVDVATVDNVANSDWQNRVEPLDVNADGFTAPNDVLTVITRINEQGAGQLPTPSAAVTSYYDTSGDGFATSRDALLVIRHLNLFSLTGGAGEPEAAAASAVAAAIDAAHAADDTSPINAVSIDFDMVAAPQVRAV